MKSRIVTAVSLVSLFCCHTIAQQQWQLALPGYHYEFPRDYFNHPDYQTEWWYYTGNLHSANGHKFGFELTFFRFGLDLPKQRDMSSSHTWLPGQLFLAHLALSDIDGKDFYHTERLNRAGPGLAGVDNQAQRYWNGNWQVQWKPGVAGSQWLQAVTDRLTLDLELDPAKPIAIHGEGGVDQKGPLRGQASHYLSFTRMKSAGHLQWKGEGFSLSGVTWMDHEYFSQQLDKTLSGWDWFAIQLDNNEELMLYRLRRKPGQEDPNSSGTYVDAKGLAHHLNAGQFSLAPSDQWKSSGSGGTYPMTWKINVPSLGLQLTEHAALDDQELFSRGSQSPTYWEGAVTYSGQIHGQSTHGVGYLEMTGYAPGGLVGNQKAD